MGTYLKDSIRKYIKFYEIIKQRNAKYLFPIFNTAKNTNQAFIGGVLQTFIQK